MHPFLLTHLVCDCVLADVADLGTVGVGVDLLVPQDQLLSQQQQLRYVVDIL